MVLGASEGWAHGGAAHAVSVDSVHVLLSSGKKSVSSQAAISNLLHH